MTRSHRAAEDANGKQPEAALALALTLALATATVAGCLGQGRDLAIDSYEEARAIDGPTYQPRGTDVPVWLKLIEPADPLEQERGQQRVVVLLFHAETDRPVRDADVRLDAHHAVTDEGTAPERNPEHRGHGMYRGTTTFDRDGRWTLNVRADLPMGGTATYEVPVYVG